MKTHSCDHCDSRCSDERISFDSITVWKKGVGHSVGNNLDLCGISCFRGYFNLLLHREDMLSDHRELVISSTCL